MDLKTRSAESSSINNKAEELRVFFKGAIFILAFRNKCISCGGGGDARIILNFFLKTAIELHVCET